MASNEWTSSSWRSKSLSQPVQYPDDQHLESVLKKIEKLPPLVHPSEIERLKHQISQVQRNEAFILHAGDCAESFEACTHENITAKIGLILSFSLVLVWGARLPIVRIGRIAGQYAKPRSSNTEKIGDREVPSFRGDNVNGLEPDDRIPNPERLLSAYFYSATTLNYIRGLLTSDFASLNHPADWSLSHVRSPHLKQEFTKIVNGLTDALDFTRTIGVATPASYEKGGGRGVLGEVDFYSSHEGLMLGYEQSLTRDLPDPTTNVRSPTIPRPDSAQTENARASTAPHNTSPSTAPYNTSAHFLWIGDRTRQIDGAHVEYFRGIKNPIGVKVGPSMEERELVRLLDILNPDKEAGRITLITRYGYNKIEAHLPAHIKAIQASGHPVAWVCDPMHGNTQTSSTGHKTRHFTNIVTELLSALSIHSSHSSVLNGVSLEFTGEVELETGFSVTECLGGSMELGEEELGLRYATACDPRLNFEQSLDLAFLVADYLKKERTGDKSGLGPGGALYDALTQS
ncbi:DAHP synthetase [Pterulicium gracile]|uniref:Phospho-2-dehydro-3-deoxyheptonate aldolase n=1 Tax=Pterulicium gracile TaxID=1884261 RepID=A0A5C3QJM4_9AGAR|nr:DAHP synthetase [Pterula gracilis]